MKKWTSSITSLLTAAVLTTAGLSAQAQQPDAGAAADNQAPPAQATAPASFSDTELAAFNQAQKEVEAIRTEISSKLESTQDPEAAHKLREEANTRMVSAVESSGLTRTKYNEIVQAVMSDPELAEKLAQLQ